MSKLLTLHRPTTISKLIQELPEQHSSPHTRANIPQWADILPSDKLPDRRCPAHSSVSRGALGNRIGQFSRSHGFDLQDPFVQIALKEYHLLHDEHLQNFWTETTKKKLKHLGQIDHDGNVDCTLREYNAFRRFCYLEIRKKIQQLLNEMDNEKEKFHNWQRIQEQLDTRMNYDEKLQQKKECAMQLYEEKLNRWKNAVKKYRERMHKATLDQALENQKRKSEGHRRDLQQAVRYTELLRSRKRNILILKRKLRERDDSLRQRILTNEQRNGEIKSTMRQERFWLHYLAYKRERAEAKETLEKWVTQTQLRINLRKERYQRNHTKLEQDLVSRKAKNLTQRYEKRSQKALVQALLRECQKHFWKSSSDNETPRADQKTIESAINAAYTIQTALSHTPSSLLIIDTASHFINDLREMPAEALPVDKLTVRYVVDRLRATMELILQDAVRQGLGLIEQVVSAKLARINSTDLNGRSSVSAFKQIVICEGTCLERARASRVSMGPVSVMEQYETDNVSFKKCKTRPPTPVTSATSLVESTLRQTNTERSCTSNFELAASSMDELFHRIHSNDYPLIHLMYSQRRYLECNLLKYRKIVQPYVEQRVFAYATSLQRLLVTGKESNEVEKDRLLHETADALLKFPTSANHYANTLSQAVHLLAADAIQMLEHILNEV